MNQIATHAMDAVVAALNGSGTSTTREFHVWYSHNDGCWKWSSAAMCCEDRT